MKILIIEDEQSNAARLQRMLEGEHEIVGVCASNAEVKTFFADAYHPDVDLILSDIQLGDGLSFESLRTVPNAIPVIFTTAYDQYAVQAFRFNSLDYLLKPIDSEELRAALAKVENKSQTSNLQSQTTTDAIAQLLESIKSQNIISAVSVQKLSTYFLGKMRIHMTAAPDEEIIVSKDKVATVKRWLDS